MSSTGLSWKVSIFLSEVELHSSQQLEAIPSRVVGKCHLVQNIRLLIHSNLSGGISGGNALVIFEIGTLLQT